MAAFPIVTHSIPMPDLKVGAGETAPASDIVDATEENFEDVVVLRSHTTPVLVDIGADWCAPCRVLGPLLHRLSASYQGRFVLANVDADENMRIAGRHKVRGFPTVIAYSHGVEVDRFHSSQTEGFLRRFIDDLIRHHAEHGHSALFGAYSNRNHAPR
jgi:putative thioredoxin